MSVPLTSGTEKVLKGRMEGTRPAEITVTTDA
jgi:hypothetical protein